MPASTGYESLTYTYEFTCEGASPVSGDLTDGTAQVELAAGTWTLTVAGSADGTRVLEGTVTDIAVSPGTSTPVSVPMKGYMGAGSGVLNYSVTFPGDVTRASLTVYPWDKYTKQGTPVDLTEGTGTDGDPEAKTAGGTISLAAGMYRIALDLYKADGVLSRADIAHIYPDMATEAPYTFAARDFIPAEVDGGQTSFAGVLQSINGLESGAGVVYTLPAENEYMSGVSISQSGPVTVTIDGGGRVVNLRGDGSLITVGENVTLVLKNITLKGGSGNRAALVTVESGGTLEMGDGVHITANTATTYYGGGVYVASTGTFTMNGGKISENGAGYYGGGVYVASTGTFTMNGGKISGNTASSTRSSPGGGGVYVASTGTFTMSGGEISGNTASGSSSSGGGVYVASTGTFTMSGGKISENGAGYHGGGVYVDSTGTFTMNDGEISGNTASGSPTSSGGGVYASTFTMSGGKISGNTASSSGGGVDVYSI
jgi:hypothetical protein